MIEALEPRALVRQWRLAVVGILIVAAALTPKRRTAGEIINASAMGMSAKSLGRVLLRLRGQTFDGKIVCGDVDQTRHQWVWWVEPLLVS